MKLYFSEKLPRDDMERRSVLAEAGIAPLCLAQQVHGETILYADESYTTTEGDALYTDRPGLFVGVKTADCVPVLLVSGVAVAAVHAGWRGTALRLAAKTAVFLRNTYNLAPKDISAYIGPCICQSCYETDEEVAAAIGLLRDSSPDAERLIARREEKFYPDLRRINELWLREAGLTQVQVSEECTRCHPERYWSHRAHGTERGLQISAVAL